MGIAAAVLVLLGLVTLGVPALLRAGGPGQTAATTPAYGFWSRDLVPTAPTQPAEDVPVTVGTEFSAARPGWVRAVRFYVVAGGARGTVATLWDARGRPLARATVAGPLYQGWQTVRFGTPVRIKASSRYVVSYRAETADYPVEEQGLNESEPLRSGVLTAWRGVFGYDGSTPGSTFRDSNYYVDLLYSPDASMGPVPDSGTPTAPNLTAGFPAGASTGATGQLARRRDTEITKAGAVLSDVLVEGQVTVYGDDVVLRNVEVRSGASFGVLVYGRNARILDTTVVGTPGSTTACIAAFEEGSVHVTRANVSLCSDGVRLNHDSSLRDSYVHELAGSEDDHFDGVTADGSRRWVIENNTIINEHPQTAAVWIGDPRYEASEGLLRGNLLSGGSYTVYAGPGVGKGLRVIDNVFVESDAEESGNFGPVTGWVAQGNTWSGNQWAGPRAGEEVLP